MQRRADKKYHTPGLWTNTCCSHPKENEDYKSAIDRRLNEEMGMKCNMEKHFSFIYKSYLSKTLTEHEHDTVFIGETNTTPNINTDEVSDFRYISLTNLKYEINKNPNKFTPWFKIIINELDSNFFESKHFYYYD